MVSNGTAQAQTELKQLLNWCERYGLIAVVELHDITGYGDKPLAGEPETAVLSIGWIRRFRRCSRGVSIAVILNIANEPFGNKAGSDQWFDFHADAIQRLRELQDTRTLPSW